MTTYEDLEKLEREGIISTEELELLKKIGSLDAEFFQKRWDRSLPFEERLSEENAYGSKLSELLSNNDQLIRHLLNNPKLRGNFNPHVLFGNLYIGLDELVKAQSILDEGQNLYGPEQNIDFKEAYEILSYKKTGK